MWPFPSPFIPPPLPFYGVRSVKANGSSGLGLSHHGSECLLLSASCFCDVLPALLHIAVFPKKHTLWTFSGQAISGCNLQQHEKIFTFHSKSEGAISTIFPPYSSWSWVLLCSVQGVLMDPPLSATSLTFAFSCDLNIAKGVPDCHSWAIYWVLDLHHFVQQLCFCMCLQHISFLSHPY